MNLEFERRAIYDSHFQGFMQGTGWLELSPAFYGFYQPAYVRWGKSRVCNVTLWLRNGLHTLFIQSGLYDEFFCF